MHLKTFNTTLWREGLIPHVVRIYFVMIIMAMVGWKEQAGSNTYILLETTANIRVGKPLLSWLSSFLPCKNDAIVMIDVVINRFGVS